MNAGWDRAHPGADGADSWAGPPARATGQYRFVLPRQLAPYYLDYQLSGSIGGQPITLGGHVEWVGATLFTEVAFRQLRVAGGTPFALTATPLYTDAQIRDKRAEILEEMTSVLGYRPVPRFARETHNGGYVKLHRHPAGPLISVTLSGADSPVVGYYLQPSGTLQTTAGGSLTSGVGNVVVEYVHGVGRVPGNGSHVAMLWAAAQLNPSGFSERQHGQHARRQHLHLRAERDGPRRVRAAHRDP